MIMVKQISATCEKASDVGWRCQPFVAIDVFRIRVLAILAIVTRKFAG